MQYNDTTNFDGIIQENERLCLLGNTAISGDTTLLKLKQFTALNNRAFNEVWMAQMDVDRNIRSDDYNWTNIPDAPITMVLGQADYTIPVSVTGADVATFLRLKGVYFLANGVKTYLDPMTDADVSTTNNGQPSKYSLSGKSTIFECPFDAATLIKYSSTFHVEFQRIFEAFVYTDTIKQPGILATYHDLIPLKSSAMYLLPTNPTLATAYDNRFYARLKLFQNDIANIDSSVKQRLSGAQQSNK